MYFVYALYNQDKNKIYIGQTHNLEDRIKRHNGFLKNKDNSFTSKNKGKWELIYKEEALTREEAVKREKQLKSYQGRKFIKSIIRIRP